jgi:hypothetical protein
VALASLPPRQFVLSVYWYYGFYEINKYEYEIAINGITSTINLIKIFPAVLELKHVDRRTDKITPVHSFCAHRAKNT